jgi:hypothetical protein
MLYSHNTTTPAPLPHRIRFADGSTRTDASTFTPDELERAGYSGPYEHPECDPTTETVDWDGAAFLVRPYSADELEVQWARVREQRNQLLQASDWTQIEDYDLGADRAAWAVYRQLLRDIGDQPNPFAITWPQAPMPWA